MAETPATLSEIQQAIIDLRADVRRLHRKWSSNIYLPGTLDFVHGGGLIFGSVSVIDNAVQTAIGGAGVPVQVVVFDTDGVANGTTPDHTNDHIVIQTNGIYLVLAAISAQSVLGAGAEFVWDIMTNNGAARVDNAHTHRYLAGAAADVGSMIVAGIAALETDDTLELWVTNNTNGQNILHVNVMLACLKVGSV